MSEDLELKVKADTGEAVANLQKTEKAVDGVTKATGELDKSAAGSGKAVADVGKSSQKSAQEVAKLGEATGSARGMFKGLAEMGGSLGQSLGVLAGKVMAVASAFTVGFQAGLKLREGMKDLGIQVPDLSDKMAKLVLATEELVRGYEKAELVESAAMNRARQIIALREAQAKSEAALAKAQAAAGVEWKSADAEREKVIQKLNAYEQILARTGKSEGEWGKAVKENAPALREAAEAADKYGINLDRVAPRTAAAAAEAEKYTEALKKVITIQREGPTVSKQTEEGMIREAEALGRANVAWEESGAARREQTTATEQAERASRDFGTSLDRVAEAVVATGGTMTVGPPMFIQYAQATREATQALLDFAVASKAVREEQAAAMEITKGWTDYILTLKDGYESGITSLYNYTTALGAFKTQLQQMFSAASGDAKDALEGMIQLIDKLIQTAGAGGNGQFGVPDFSPIRQLQREFEK